jgi:hypothetical protein
MQAPPVQQVVMCLRVRVSILQSKVVNGRHLNMLEHDAEVQVGSSYHHEWGLESKTHINYSSQYLIIEKMQEGM